MCLLNSPPPSPANEWHRSCSLQAYTGPQGCSAQPPHFTTWVRRMWALQDLFRFPAVTGPPPPGQQDPALLQSIRRPRSSRKGRVRGLINRGGGVESSGPERGLDSGDSWLAMWPIRKGRGFGLVARDRPGARGGTPISRQKPKMLLGRKSPVPPPQSAGMKLVGY